MKKRIICILFLIFSITLTQGNSAQMRADTSPQVKVNKKSYVLRPKSGIYFTPTIPKSSALNTDTGETLVVWQVGNGTSTFGRILSATGRGTKKKFEITSSAIHYGLGAAYNPSVKEYLVLYALHDHGSILGMRFDSNAKAIGKEFTVLPETLTEIHEFPSPIFNPQTNGYTLLWQRSDGIAGTLLDQSGKISGTSVVIKKNPGKNGYYDDAYISRILGAVLFSSGKKLLVLIQQRSGEFELDYYLASVDPMLKKVKSAKKINGEPAQIPPGAIPYFHSYGATLVGLPDGSAAVFYADGKSVKRREIDLRGKFSGPSSPAFSAPLSTTALRLPRVAFSTTTKGTVGLLIASQFDESNIQDSGFAWAQVLDANGRSVGDPIDVYDYPAYDWPGDSSLLALPRKPSDILFHFQWIQLQYILAPGEGPTGSILNFKLEVQP